MSLLIIFTGAAAAPPPSTSVSGVWLVLTGSETEPRIVLEIAPSANPLDVPSIWYDISDAFLEGTVRRGRQRVLDEVQAGSADILLENLDRAFDPTYTSGPYYPLYPMMQIRLRAFFEGSEYGLFRGFVEDWPVDWSDSFYPTTRVRCVDAIALLAIFGLDDGSNHNLAQDTSGNRIGDLLDLVGWPASLRNLDTGGGTCASKWLNTPNTEKAWPQIQLAVNTGDPSVTVCFVDGHGNVAYSSGSASGVTFGDSGGSQLPYEGAALHYGVDLIYNDIRVTREGGTEQKATNATSMTRYGVRQLSRTTLHNSDANALTCAQQLRAAYKDPKARPERMVVKPVASSSVWTQVLARELMDSFTLSRTPPGGGSAYSQSCEILGLEHKIPRVLGEWETSYSLVGSTL